MPLWNDRRAEHGPFDLIGDVHGWGWRAMWRNAGVYVRGRIRHPDHATITLHGWHRVLMNTESQSKAMRNVAFLIDDRIMMVRQRPVAATCRCGPVH